MHKNKEKHRNAILSRLHLANILNYGYHVLYLCSHDCSCSPISINTEHIKKRRLHLKPQQLLLHSLKQNR